MQPTTLTKKRGAFYHTQPHTSLQASREMWSSVFYCMGCVLGFTFTVEEAFVSSMRSESVIPAHGCQNPWLMGAAGGCEPVAVSVRGLLAAHVSLFTDCSDKGAVRSRPKGPPQSVGLLFVVHGSIGR